MRRVPLNIMLLIGLIPASAQAQTFLGVSGSGVGSGVATLTGPGGALLPVLSASVGCFFRRTARICPSPISRVCGGSDPDRLVREHDQPDTLRIRPLHGRRGHDLRQGWVRIRHGDGKCGQPDQLPRE